MAPIVPSALLRAALCGGSVPAGGILQALAACWLRLAPRCCFGLLSVVRMANGQWLDGWSCAFPATRSAAWLRSASVLASTTVR
jgi:hypothetical protein